MYMYTDDIFLMGFQYLACLHNVPYDFFFSVSSLKDVLGNSSLDLTKLWHVWSNLYQPSQIWNEKGVAHGIHIDTAAKGVQLAKRANLSTTWSHYLTFAWLIFPGHHYHK